MKNLSVYSGVSPLVVWKLKSGFLIDKQMRTGSRVSDYYDPLETYSGIVSRIPAESSYIYDGRNCGVGAEEGKESKGRKDERERERERRDEGASLAHACRRNNMVNSAKRPSIRPTVS